MSWYIHLIGYTTNQFDNESSVDSKKHNLTIKKARIQMKKIVIGIIIFALVVLGIEGSVFAHNPLENQIESVETIDCHFCGHHTMTVSCGTFHGSNNTACSVVSGCVKVEEVYTNHYSCSFCEANYETYSQGNTHIHMHHTVCKTNRPCRYSNWDI